MNELMAKEKEQNEIKIDSIKVEFESVIEELQSDLKDAVIEAQNYRSKYEATNADLEKEQKFADETKIRLD